MKGFRHVTRVAFLLALLLLFACCAGGACASGLQEADEGDFDEYWGEDDDFDYDGIDAFWIGDFLGNWQLMDEENSTVNISWNEWDGYVLAASFYRVAAFEAKLIDEDEYGAVLSFRSDDGMFSCDVELLGGAFFLSVDAGGDFGGFFEGSTFLCVRPEGTRYEWLGTWYSDDGESLYIPAADESGVVIVYTGLTAAGDDWFSAEYDLAFEDEAMTVAAEDESVLAKSGWRYRFVLDGDCITMESRYPDRYFYREYYEDEGYWEGDYELPAWVDDCLGEWRQVDDEGSLILTKNGPEDYRLDVSFYRMTSIQADWSLVGDVGEYLIFFSDDGLCELDLFREEGALSLLVFTEDSYFEDYFYQKTFTYTRDGSPAALSGAPGSGAVLVDDDVCTIECGGLCVVPFKVSPEPFDVPAYLLHIANNTGQTIELSGGSLDGDPAFYYGGAGETPISSMVFADAASTPPYFFDTVIPTIPAFGSVDIYLLAIPQGLYIPTVEDVSDIDVNLYASGIGGEFWYRDYTLILTDW